MTQEHPQSPPSTDEIVIGLASVDRRLKRLEQNRLLRSPCWTIAGGVVLGFLLWIVIVIVFWIVVSLLGIGALGAFGR